MLTNSKNTCESLLEPFSLFSYSVFHLYGSTPFSRLLLFSCLSFTPCRYLFSGFSVMIPEVAMHQGRKVQQQEQDAERPQLQPHRESREPAGVGQGHKRSSPPLVTYRLQQGCTSEGPITSPTRTTDWEPRLQIPEPLRNIFIHDTLVA